MKKTIVLLSTLSLALAAALWVNRQNAAERIQRAVAEIGSLTNRLTEAEMKLNHQERMNVSLGSNLTNRTDELARSANALATARARLARSKTETRVIQQQLEAARSEIQAAQSRLAELSNRIEELTAESSDKDSKVAQAQAQLVKANARSVALAYQLGELRQENDRMTRQLNDPELLRKQIAALKQQQLAAAESRRPNNSARSDFRLDLELLPDGNVRFMVPATNRPPDF